MALHPKTVHLHPAFLIQKKKTSSHLVELVKEDLPSHGTVKPTGVQAENGSS